MADKKNPTMDEVQEQVRQMLEMAKAEAAKIVAQAKESVGMDPQLDEKRKAELARGEEYVEVKLFKDNGQYKDDVFVAVNGRAFQIMRGVEVEVPDYVEEVLKHSEEQDARTAEMIEHLESAYAAHQ